MRTIWITGAGGLIGHHLWRVARLQTLGAEVIPLARQDLDLLDFNAVQRRFATDRPNALLHCAALSRSRDCEAHPSMARRLNVEVTRLLADLFAHGRMILFSSDLVFDGRKGDYDEDCPINPLSLYGETKALAEQIVLRHSQNIVLRTSLNAGNSPPGDRGCDEQIMEAWRRGESLRFFTDEFRCPIHAEVTSHAAWELLEIAKGGIYHVAGAERLSRWHLGCLIAERCAHLNPNFSAASLKEYSGPPRSPDTSLNCNKAQSLLPFPLPRFSDWLEVHPPTLGP